MKDMLRPRGPKDNSRRKGVPAMRKEQRRKDGEVRQAAYNKLTTAEKIAKLDAGGHAATKQRARLLAKA